MVSTKKRGNRSILPCTKSTQPFFSNAESAQILRPPELRRTSNDLAAIMPEQIKNPSCFKSPEAGSQTHQNIAVSCRNHIKGAQKHSGQIAAVKRISSHIVSGAIFRGARTATGSISTPRLLASAPKSRAAMARDAASRCPHPEGCSTGASASSSSRRHRRVVSWVPVPKGHARIQPNNLLTGTRPIRLPLGQTAKRGESSIAW